MYYVVQENTFSEEGHDRLLEALERLSLDHEVIRVLPFVEELQFETDRTDVFVFGSIKLARLASKYPWEPGAFPMPHNSFQHCLSRYGSNMLNHDSAVYFLGELAFSSEFEDDYFIRPCDDTKLFKGGMYMASEWKKLLDRIVANEPQEQWENQSVQVVSYKLIQKEFRFWVVNSRIVTSSSYRIGGRPTYTSPVDEAAAEFCQDMVKIFCPAPAFVMDICLTEDRYRIVECGCINTAGFYNADMNRLVIALEEGLG